MCIAGDMHSLLINFKDNPGASLKRPTTALHNLIQEMYNVDFAQIFWSKNVMKNMIVLIKNAFYSNYLKLHDIHKEVQKIISMLLSKIQMYSHK